MRLKILAFACGVLFLQMQGELPALSAIVSLFVVIITGVVLSRRYRHEALRYVLTFCCLLGGVIWAGLMAHQRLSGQLPKAWEAREIEIVGVIASLPQRFERGERFEFDVESVHTSGATVPPRIMLSWYRNWDEPDQGGEVLEKREVHPGERWRLTVRLKRPHGNANPFGFDYEAWLFERSIRATGTIRQREDNQRLTPFVWHPGYAVERLRELIRKRFFDEMPDAPYLGVLIALTVGDQRAIPNGNY
jgi:competence protein ComEC